MKWYTLTRRLMGTEQTLFVHLSHMEGVVVGVGRSSGVVIESGLVMNTSNSCVLLFVVYRGTSKHCIYPVYCSKSNCGFIVINALLAQ